MATTQAARGPFPVSARRLRGPAHDRDRGTRALYDQEVELAVPEAARVASPDPVRVRRTAHDQVSRWLALFSLVLVTFIVALIIFS